MSTNNTAFSPNADLVAQITGSGQLTAGQIKVTTATTPVAYVASGNTNILPALVNSRFLNITTATGNTTILAANSCVPAGGRVVIQINNDASGARTITFGTGFRTTGTIVGNTSQAWMIEFVSDGTTLNEISRNTGSLA